MKPNRTKLLYGISLVSLLFLAMQAFARFGGAGGHGGGHYGGGGHSGGGGFFIWYLIFNHPILSLIIIAIVFYLKYNRGKNTGNINETRPVASSVSFPAGLDIKKISGSFLTLQDAWQRKDSKNIRKWISDGMYQRLACQFKMMDALGQVNTLSNIQINNIAACNTYTDGNYQVADIAISFRMDDRFTSNKYPQFNENYVGDAATEYWTFMKRSDSKNDKNLYDNNNCPNCGAPFEVKMGEISRCNYCKTLANSAAYDWVLSEITQEADYRGGAGLSQDQNLKGLTKNDPFFGVQRMEDIASNIFMQVMEVLTGSDKTRLTRFADERTENFILQQKQNQRPFIFDRLYLNNVTLSSYNVDNNLVTLHFDLSATYRRVAIGDKVQMLDSDFVTRHFSMELSRNKDVQVNTGTGETVYSYECSSCGAPYTDTTDDRCTYCNAPVIDKQRNWVLTGFVWG